MGPNPQLVGPDTISRQIVTEFNWIRGHLARVHCGICQRIAWCVGKIPHTLASEVLNDCVRVESQRTIGFTYILTWLCMVFKKACLLLQYHKNVFLCFILKAFWFYLLYLDLHFIWNWFLCVMWLESWYIFFLTWLSSVPRTFYLKDSLFHQFTAVSSFSWIRWLYTYGSFFLCYVLSHWSSCLSSCQRYTILIIMAL